MTLLKDPEGNEIKALRRHADFSGQRVLEIGCGDGRLTWRYAKAAKQVTAFDLDRDELRVANIERPSDLEGVAAFVLANALHLPFASATFDIAVLAWSF